MLAECLLRQNVLLTKEAVITMYTGFKQGRTIYRSTHYGRARSRIDFGIMGKKHGSQDYFFGDVQCFCTVRLGNKIFRCAVRTRFSSFTLLPFTLLHSQGVQVYPNLTPDVHGRNRVNCSSSDVSEDKIEFCAVGEIMSKALFPPALCYATANSNEVVRDTAVSFAISVNIVSVSVYRENLKRHTSLCEGNNIANTIVRGFFPECNSLFSFKYAEYL